MQSTPLLKPELHTMRKTLGGGSCDFQPSFKGGSLSFVPNGRGGSCVFQPPHFEMLRAPLYFLTSPLINKLQRCWKATIPGAVHFALVLCPHPGAFRHLTCPHPREFAHFLKKKTLCPGFAGAAGGEEGGGRGDGHCWNRLTH